MGAGRQMETKTIVKIPTLKGAYFLVRGTEKHIGKIHMILDGRKYCGEKWVKGDVSEEGVTKNWGAWHLNKTLKKRK